MPELIPVDHDPFAEPKGPSLVPVNHDPFAKPPPRVPTGSLWENIKSIPGGLVKGFADAASAAGQAAQAEMSQPIDVPSGEEVAHHLEKNITGELPATGAYGRTVGEFLGNPGSYVGPGGVLPKAAWATISGLGSEAAGQLTAGTKAEPWARFLGAAATPATLSTAHRMVAPRPLSPANAAAAERLRQQGIETSAGEVTDAKSLQNIEAEAGRPYQEFKQQQSQNLTRAALRPIAPTAEQLAVARARARTPDEHAAINEWERTANGDHAHDAVQAARPMIGQQIEHAARDLEVHSDPELLNTLIGIERRLNQEGFHPNHPTVQRLQGMRDNILGAFDLQPGPRPRNPSWTGTWGSANQESTVTLRRPRPGHMWNVEVDGVHENAFNTRADAERYIGQYLNNMQPVVPPGRMVMNGRAFHNQIEHTSALSRASRGNDSDIAFYASEMKRALMDAAERTGYRRNTVPGTGAQAAYERFSLARRQWANLLALEHASSVGAAKATARGELNPVAIRRAATFRDTSDYARGRGDFNELARDANHLISEPPNSGTPGRLRIGARAAGSAIGTGLGAMLGSGAGPWGAAAGAGTLGSIGAVAAPIAQSRFVMNPTVQRYLRSGRWQPAPRAERTLRNIRAAGTAAASGNPYQP